MFLNVLSDDILIDAYRTHVLSPRPQGPPSPRLHWREPVKDHQGTFPFEVAHKLGYTQLRRDFHVDLYVIHTDTAFHPFHTLVLTEPSQYFPNFLANLCEESLAAIFRDKYDRITAIPTGVGQAIGTHGHRPPLLENWLAKPFPRIAREDCYITPHGFSYSVLPRIAWDLMFELFYFTDLAISAEP